MTELAICVANLAKMYRIGQRRAASQTLRETIMHAVGSPLRYLRQHSSPDETAVWALRDVSFDVEPGDALAVIGSNGSGKSTLLKILTRITYPTRGRVEFRGRVGALLEAGAGFHLELTGRENVFLNGAVLGMKKAEVKRRFDEIVAFAEVERFLDTPVKRYSSGMRMRLAFAVAAHVEPDILLVDEVLAVGDASFQKKCLARLNEAAQQGRTILFVSHSMAAVRSLCNKAMLLDKGMVQMIGPPEEVIRRYLGDESEHKAFREWPDGYAGAGVSELSIRSLRLVDAAGRTCGFVDARQSFSLEIRYIVHRPLQSCIVGFQLSSMDGVLILEDYDRGYQDLSGERLPGEFISRCTIPGRLLRPGKYAISLHSQSCGVKNLATIENALSLEIRPPQVGPDALGIPDRGVIRPALSWSVEHVALEMASAPHQVQCDALRLTA